MTFTGDPNSAPVLPTAAEAAVAKTSSRALASHLENHPSDESLKLILNEKEGKTIEIPAAALPLLLAILQQTSSGNTVKLTPITKELDIWQVEGLLNVSREYVWQLLDDGKIPYKMVQSCRRIRYEDVMKYKKQSYEKSMKGMDELVAESEALGLYD
ncbi:MAG: excisionase family DNA-binding protein [Microcoleus sp. PH2017_10_PVI_O_A]|uniref:excisionase family DNA-binding protein n=1 Tax=unclassified Microcoleus TaxID=2642155 RepID=UPI001D7EE5C7|nr:MULTISPECIES: excisionase family DNA-binding protein [unclassified Microcoleus]TAE83149.1 MAG: DNA-binding protein [Oscillatoriales cyanobacterium]MCC3406330.1 excisionase family DNA-binding protein [Microcoleus sp. PH2017_10_PVI_O_A]MCC3460314.1 excisionase family DNA-binding protein [Microcoleus sp. PH2017_11_PCY_U_A]MCC3478847.1 excisionase family DNA-binding protein [Microcoleus sp. PH2017_12_PCY_D_A]MCC3528459.1 excisionase family DNA-binding protein [Microcoleus sp. PH2017_21_RUC_O_A]